MIKTTKNLTFKVGDKVYDTWRPTLTGTITRVGKEYIKVEFENDAGARVRRKSYFAPYAKQFLKRVP